MVCFIGLIRLADWNGGKKHETHEHIPSQDWIIEADKAISFIVAYIVHHNHTCFFIPSFISQSLHVTMNIIHQWRISISHVTVTERTKSRETRILWILWLFLWKSFSRSLPFCALWWWPKCMIHQSSVVCSACLAVLKVQLGWEDNTYL